MMVLGANGGLEGTTWGKGTTPDLWSAENKMKAS